MKNTLEKLSWATRKWNYEFELLVLNLNSRPGFSVFTIHVNHKEYSLLSFKFRLPNKTNIKDFVVDEWDILFVYNYLWDQYDDLSESRLWGVELKRWELVKLKLLDKIFNK